MKKLLSIVSLSLILAIRTPLSAMEEDVGVVHGIKIAAHTKVVVSLDGGGTPSIGSVRILDLLFKAVQEKLGKNGKSSTPQDVVDLFVGTSSGGMIATLLGFGKSPAEIEEAIESGAGKVFPQDMYTWGTRLGGLFWKSRYPSQPFEASLKEMLGENTPFGDAKPPVCVTTFCPYNEKYYLIDSLDAITFPGIEAWRACRATTAHPTLYSSPVIQHKDGPIQVQDGGTGAINPSTLAFGKAREWFSDEKVILISIGAGHHPLLKMDSDQGVLEFLPHMQEDLVASEAAATEAFLQGELDNHHYFRFQYLINSSVVPDTVDKDALEKIKKEAEGIKDTPEFTRLVDYLVMLIGMRGNQ